MQVIFIEVHMTVPHTRSPRYRLKQQALVFPDEKGYLHRHYPFKYYRPFLKA
jgi:hypothetical protein